MSDNIAQLKRSATPGKVPLTAELLLGEPAVNTYDGKMYIKKDDGAESVVEIGGNTLTNIGVTANYTADDRVFVKVDTTTSGLTITLPSAATFVNKFFHIKWIAGSSSNKVTIAPQTSEAIDDETSIIMGHQYDSLNVVSDGTSWWII